MWLTVVNGPKRGPFRLRGDGEARASEGADGDPAAVDAQPNEIVVADVEIRMRTQKRRLLGCPERGQTTNVVMAVALDVAEPEQRDERQVLLHGQARLSGEIFGRHEERVAAGLLVPSRAAGEIH